MPNQDARGHGERIASLEERFNHLLARINHLDVCLDEAKTQAAKDAAIIKKKLDTWDGRWKYGIGIIIGTILASGSGTVSLKSLIDLLSKLR